MKSNRHIAAEQYSRKDERWKKNAENPVLLLIPPLSPFSFFSPSLTLMWESTLTFTLDSFELSPEKNDTISL